MFSEYPPLPPEFVAQLLAEPPHGAFSPLTIPQGFTVRDYVYDDSE